MELQGKGTAVKKYWCSFDPKGIEDWRRPYMVDGFDYDTEDDERWLLPQFENPKFAGALAETLIHLIENGLTAVSSSPSGL